MEKTKDIAKIVAKKKSHKKFLLIISFIIVASLIGLLVGYIRVSNNPYMVYKSTINKTFKTIDKNLNKIDDMAFKFNLKDDYLRLAYDFNVEAQNRDYFTDREYEIQLGLNIPDKEINFEASMDADDNLYNLLISLIDNNIYIKSDDVFNYPLKMQDFSYFSSLNIENVNIEDFKTLSQILNKVLIQTLKEENFTVTKTKITIEGRTYNVKEFKYTLNATEIKETLNFIENKLTKDEEFLAILADISQTSNADVQEFLKNFIANIEIADDTTLEFNLYTKGLNNLIAGNVLYNEQTLIKFYNLDILDIKIGGATEYFELIKDDNETKMNIYENEEKIFSINVKNTKESLAITFNQEQEKNIIKINLEDIKITTKEITSNLTIYIENSQEEIELFGELLIDKNSVASIDIDQAFDYNDLASSKQDEINDNLDEIKDYFINEIEPNNNSTFIEIDSNDIAELFTIKGLKLLYFGRSTCSVCTYFSPIIKEAALVKNIPLYYVALENTTSWEEWQDKLADIASKANITSSVTNDEETIGNLLIDYGYTPLVLVIQDDKVVDGFVGGINQNKLNDFLDKYTN